MDEFGYFWKVYNHVLASSVVPFEDATCEEYFYNDIICRKFKNKDEWRIMAPNMLAVINHKEIDDGMLFYRGELSDLISLHDKLFSAKV